MKGKIIAALILVFCWPVGLAFTQTMPASLHVEYPGSQVSPVVDIRHGTSPPPEFVSLERRPAMITSADDPLLLAQLRDMQSTISEVNLIYRVNGGNFQSLSMPRAAPAFWQQRIPAQANGAFVEYLITAINADGDTAYAPTDTSKYKFCYFVRDEGFSIFDLQYSPYDSTLSPYNRLMVIVSGTVTSNFADFPFYFIQDGTDPWHGIHVDDNITRVKLGDDVTVTGFISEQSGETQIVNVISVTINSSGNAVPGPIRVQTGDLNTGSATAEQWEGMLMQVENVTVTDPFPDHPDNFGEFTVDDGSGGVRIDDLGDFSGNQDSAFVQGQAIASIVGIQYFSSGNFKMIPRNDGDVSVPPVSVQDDRIPLTFALRQNYPNPFNPETTIAYSLPNESNVEIRIYNGLGQLVRSLEQGRRQAGAYLVRWDGTNQYERPVSSGVYYCRMIADRFTQVRPMILLR